MNRLDDAREDYADENLPVFLLLGLVSALQRLEPLLPPTEAPCVATEASECPTGEASPPGSARFLCLVLGLIAFRRHLLATLAAEESIAARGALLNTGQGLPTTPAGPTGPRDASRDSLPWVPPTAAAPTVPPVTSVGTGPSEGPASRPPSLRELLR